MITADSHKTKNVIEQDERWMKVIEEKTQTKGQQFTIKVHAMRTSEIETANQEKALAELQAQDPELRDKVKLLKLTWQQKVQRAGKLHGPLLVDVRTRKKAKTLVQEGLLHENELKNCKFSIMNAQ